MIGSEASSSNISSTTTTTTTTTISTSSCKLVANSFVRKYYSMLNTTPAALFHFYKEDSSLTIGNEEMVLIEDPLPVIGKDVSLFLHCNSSLFLNIIRK